jgi:hypothetical protein
MMQEQQYMGNVEKGRSTTTNCEMTFEEMLNAIEVSLSNLSTSKDEADGADEDDDEEYTGHGTLSEDDKPVWVMSTISTIVQHCMESFRPKQLRLDELRHPGGGIRRTTSVREI